VSTTATRNEAEAELPRLSAAVQVTVVVPTGNNAPESGVHVTGSGPSTTSEAVGAGVNVTRDPAGPNASSVCVGGTTIVGPASVTTTLNAADPLFPAASAAVQVTVVVPTGNVDPEAGAQVGVIAPDTASVAEAENVTTAPVGPVAAAVIAEDGIVTTGATVSATVTLNPPVATLPAASWAEQLTGEVPIGNADPEGGVHETATAPLMSSTADAV
jgi:hypothetical protein